MKKILALALALVIALSLAACGGKDDPKPPAAGSSDTQQADPSISQQEELSRTPNESTPSNDESTTSDGAAEFEGAYSDAQLEFISSLGKTETGKRLVCFNEYDPTLAIYVVEWDEAENQSTSILVYTFNLNQEYYERDRDVAANYPSYKECSDEIMMYLMDQSDSFGSKVDECTSFEQMADEVFGGAYIL